MRKKVYIETSVISYLCARPSRDLILAANQEITREWWDNREQYDLFISEFVFEEISRGDTEAAIKRNVSIDNIPMLPLTAECNTLAKELIDKHAFPKIALTDASHVSIASIFQMDFLLSWNCKHIVNPHMQNKIRRTVEASNYRLPVICTPFELLEDIEHEE